MKTCALPPVAITLWHVIACALIALLFSSCKSNEGGVGLFSNSDEQPTEEVAPAGEGTIVTEDSPPPIVIPAENTLVGTISWINRDARQVVINLSGNYANLGAYLAVLDKEDRIIAILIPVEIRPDENSAVATILEGLPTFGQQVIIPDYNTLNDIFDRHGS